MSIEVCRPDELGDSEVALWRAWQRADPRLSNPFLAPEFAMVLARHNRAAQIAVLREGNETVGFLPFERHPGGVGRSLAYGLTDCQALIGPATLTWDPKELLARCRLAVFEFDHLVAHQVQAWAPRTVSHHDAPVVDLAGDWDSWLARKRKASGRLRTILQLGRKLGREWGEVDFEFDTRSEADLDQLIEWKGAQFVRTGLVNRFGKPWFRDFVAELFATRTESFVLGMARLRAGGRTVALDLSPRAGGALAGWFTTYAPAARLYSPGMTSLLSLIRTGREHGIVRIELGRGEHDYKHLFADFVDQVAEGVVERPSGTVALRRVLTAPRRVATDLLLSRPQLRVAARETLGQVGRVRTHLS